MHLALDTSNSIEVAIHGLKEMERLQKKTYDAIMYLQPTTPFRSCQDINDSIDLLYKNEKAKLLPHINNGHDFDEMLSELLGELNASHTGSGYRFSMKGGDRTASLGIYPDYVYDGTGI